MEQQALDLLDAGYRKAVYQERGRGNFLLTFLDGDVALSVGLNPTARDTPEGRTYNRVVDSLIAAGAVQIPDIREQDLPGSIVYEITPRGEEMLREAGRIP